MKSFLRFAFATFVIAFVAAFVLGAISSGISTAEGPEVESANRVVLIVNGDTSEVDCGSKVIINID